MTLVYGAFLGRRVVNRARGAEAEFEPLLLPGRVKGHQWVSMGAPNGTQGPRRTFKVNVGLLGYRCWRVLVSLSGLK